MAHRYAVSIKQLLAVHITFIAPNFILAQNMFGRTSECRVPLRFPVFRTDPYAYLTQLKIHAPEVNTAKMGHQRLFLGSLEGRKLKEL